MGTFAWRRVRFSRIRTGERVSAHHVEPPRVQTHARRLLGPSRGVTFPLRLPSRLLISWPWEVREGPPAQLLALHPLR